jgi:hypothetical protein
MRSSFVKKKVHRARREREIMNHTAACADQPEGARDGPFHRAAQKGITPE